MHAPSETEQTAASIRVGEPPEPADSLSSLPAEPLVSIVVPCRNPGPRLDFALLSLRRQTYRHLEVIVIDGASTDGTAARLPDLCEPTWRFLSEPDQGQSDAISKGFRQAKGEILTWLNADDALLPEAVETWVDLLRHDSRPALAYGGCYEWYEEVGWMVPAPWIQPPSYRILRDRSDYIMQPAAAFRAEAFQAVGGLDGALHYAMDWDLWLKLSRAWPVLYTPRVLAMNRVHTDTKTTTGGRRRIGEIRAIGRRHGRRPAALADHRYALVELSQRHPAVGWLRGCYKRLWARSGAAAGIGGPARYAPSQIRALPLSRPRQLWVSCEGNEDRLVLKLQGRLPASYTVRVDGADLTLPAEPGGFSAAVSASRGMCRLLELPALPGARLRHIAFAKESEPHT